ncbi:TrbL/VirB6 plasmid conjugal transfer protein [Haloactinopolyspora alba]|uniref:TrbL/VirB6 plasmid conjugal transfer protein n=1 Tax=Haloactinopolyspora alba TaxID=648780 RepID=A0A2P8EFE7_9ACTN|nr:type IV secretion system protein [Haloactinopolyspora alba]PSL08180.1 TrbL/VirB6 plasmid conjugal transfer protein [Haloactinopolyspora alba]
MTPMFDVCDVPVVGSGCTILEGPSGWFKDMVTAAAGAIFGFAMSLMSWIWNLITTTTSPHTDAGFVYEWAGRVFGIALPITVGFLAIQVMTVMLRNRSTAGIGKSVALAGTAVLGTAASLPIIHLLTTAVDGLSEDLTAITFGDLDGVGDRFTTVLSSVLESADAVPGQEANYALLGGGSIVAGAFGFIVFGIFLVFGSLAVFAALLVRTMLLDIAVVLGPLAIMGLAWEKTHGWFKKWVSLVVALIFTKLAVMIVFGLGVSGLESLSFGDDGAGIVGVLLTSTLMLLLAALVPVACFKFMSFLGDEIEAGSLHGAGTAAASRGREVAGRANPAQIMNARSGGGGAGGSGGSSSGGGSGGSSGGGQRSTPQPDPAAASGTAGGAAGAAAGGGGAAGASSRDDAATSPTGPTSNRAEPATSGAGASSSGASGATGTATAGNGTSGAGATGNGTAAAGGGAEPRVLAPAGPTPSPASGSSQGAAGSGPAPSAPSSPPPSAERGGPDLTRRDESGGS